MKEFYFKLSLFILFLFGLMILGFFLPVTPRDKQSLLFSQIFKDSLLTYSESPRIILIGGSNLSMGINSNLLKHQLKLNPVNTSIHAAIGLKYMMQHTLKFVKPGDVVIISPEYHQFFDDLADGGEELLRIIADFDKKELLEIELSQMLKIYRLIPQYSYSKFKFQEYFYNRNELFLYGADGYNKFGDYEKHWNLKPLNAPIYDYTTQIYNPSVVNSIIEFRHNLNKIGVDLFITFPGYQYSSFRKNLKHINYINSILVINKFKILGEPSRYIIPDSLMYGTSYHLSKKAVDLRTNLLIEDFKMYKINKK